MKIAILVSGLTFGAGHVANLAIGAEMFETLLQMICAMAIGFMFACFVYGMYILTGERKRSTIVSSK